ncbi:MAG: PASTA domain-containing protein [Pyrinomonadaceae bacterium]|nr:PASTA domain-containing protein [Pyrinomonadaceae bacterium]
MGIFKAGISALGKLLIALTLLATFMAGMLGVVYYQLRGEEVSIPKVVGKNFNDGREDLSGLGLRIKKIATRYSNEEPNTILEQRPRAGSIAKSGLMISVVVSEPNPDGRELTTEVKDDEQVIGEIEQQPELKIDKQKPRTKSKKTSPKTRDVIKKEPEEEKSDEAEKASEANPVPGQADSKKPTVKPEEKPANPVTTPKPAANPPAKPPADQKGKQKPKPKPKDN